MKLKFLSVIGLSFLLVFSASNAEAQGLFSKYNKKEKVVGNGDVQSKIIETNAFKKIDVGGTFDVIIKQGDTPGVRIESDSNYFMHIETKVKNGELQVEMSDEIDVTNPTALNLFITVNELSSLNVSGASDIKTEGEISIDRLKVHISGASDVSLAVDGTALILDASGASDMNLKGNVKIADLEVSGAGSIQAYGLEVIDASVAISGTGSAQLNVRDNLTASVSGVGSLNYIGDPKITKSISGMGSVKSK